MKLTLAGPVPEKWVEIDDDGTVKSIRVSNSSGLHIDITSVNEERDHHQFDEMVGRNVRISVEIIEWLCQDHPEEAPVDQPDGRLMCLVCRSLSS